MDSMKKKFYTLLGLAVLALWTGMVANFAQHPEGVVWRNLSPAVWLFQGVPLGATYTPTALKSLQRGTITIPGGGNTTANATITAVVSANARLRWLGQSLDAGDPSRGFGYLTLANTTTVTATRTSGFNVATLSFEVAEYLPQFVQSVQRGTITTTTVLTNTATVSSVNTAKAELDYLGSANNDTASGNAANTLTRLSLTNGTTITATVETTNNTQTTGYQLWEWK